MGHIVIRERWDRSNPPSQITHLLNQEGVRELQAVLDEASAKWDATVHADARIVGAEGATPTGGLWETTLTIAGSAAALTGMRSVLNGWIKERKQPLEIEVTYPDGRMISVKGRTTTEIQARTITGAIELVAQADPADASNVITSPEPESQDAD
ncbi:effector-associated constant component EACC1 [Streptomyces sp. 24-1644]|uniref:effector-associated constant component EACC1 n=1 Tax=Streptomyces sp. 24-1644 TaxID=3457315 RepID=UPI003FA6EF82